MIYFHNDKVDKIIPQISFDIDTRMSSYVAVEIQPCNDYSPVQCKIPIAKIYFWSIGRNIPISYSPDSTRKTHVTNIVESR